MATFTKSVTETDYISDKPATWSISITGQDITVSDSSFVYPYYTIKSKYVQQSGDSRNVGNSWTQHMNAYADAPGGRILLTSVPMYYFGGGTPDNYSYKTMASGTFYTLTPSSYSGYSPSQNTILTSSVFNENNNTTRVVNVVQPPLTVAVATWIGDSGRGQAQYGGISAGVRDLANYVLGSITLNVPPTATVGLLNRTTASGYYAGATSVYVPITDLTAYYGGNFTDGQGGVTLEIGNQTSTIHADGAITISPLNAVGTFTPKVTVTDSRGQTYVETLDPITVAEYKPTSHILNLQRINATGEPSDDPAPEEASDEGTNAVVACQFDYPTISNNYMEAPIVKIDGASPTNTVTWYTSWTENSGFSGQVNFSSYNPTRPVTLYGKITDTLATTSSYDISVACDTTLGSGDADSQTLPQAFYLLSAAAGGHGLGVGMKVPPSANGQGLHVGMDATFYENLYAPQLPGIIKMFAGTFAPTGWLLCNGDEVAVADYPFLYDVIGDTYGTPSDSDHFVLPDFRGRIPVGSGTGTASGATNHALGQKAGSETHTLTEQQLPSITGSFTSRAMTSSAYVIGSGTGKFSHATTSAAWGRGIAWNSDSTSQKGLTVTYKFGGGNSHPNMQPYTVVNYIISTGGVSRWSDSAGLPIVRDVTVNGQSVVNNEIANVDAVPTSRTVNNKALSSNISLTASDVGAVGSWVSKGSATGTTNTVTVPDTAKEVYVLVHAGNGYYQGTFPVGVAGNTRPVLGGYYSSSSDYGTCTLNVSNSNKTYQIRNVVYAAVNRNDSASMYVYYR